MFERTSLEKKLAILTLQNEIKTVPEYTFFGDNNHEIINNAISLIKGDITMDEIYDLESNEEISENTVINLNDYYDWLTNEDLTLLELLWNKESLVTEISNDNVINVCKKMCNECPFSKNSVKGWLADYNIEDFISYLSKEISFPCHKMMSEDDLTVEEVSNLVNTGKIKLCRGYVESIIKSHKLPYENKSLLEAINIVKQEGLSEHSMSIFEFKNHHNVFTKKN